MCIFVKRNGHLFLELRYINLSKPVYYYYYYHVAICFMMQVTFLVFSNCSKMAQNLLNLYLYACISQGVKSVILFFIVWTIKASSSRKCVEERPSKDNTYQIDSMVSDWWMPRVGVRIGCQLQMELLTPGTKRVNRKWIKGCKNTVVSSSDHS